MPNNTPTTAPAPVLTPEQIDMMRRINMPVANIHGSSVSVWESHEALRRQVAALTEDRERARVFDMAVREIVDGSAPRPVGGQHVGVQKYQMTPSTRKRLQWVLDNYGVREAIDAARREDAATRTGEE